MNENIHCLVYLYCRLEWGVWPLIPVQCSSCPVSVLSHHEVTLGVYIHMLHISFCICSYNFCVPIWGMPNNIHFFYYKLSSVWKWHCFKCIANFQSVLSFTERTLRTFMRFLLGVTVLSLCSVYRVNLWGTTDWFLQFALQFGDGKLTGSVATLLTCKAKLRALFRTGFISFIFESSSCALRGLQAIWVTKSCTERIASNMSSFTYELT